ncbi:lung adenoma susceptibility protein 2 isoform X3 [Athene cunicularia]|uniref:lung adenoma susceptibility protein 2 isoform X3 n=1 Tax=Athene cunicularia TaxID=194338 RepID=UPI000EF71CF8|nr:lung adenoma susceptibility protein 2 isoform X3 [Athene cunicularia]
MTSSIKESSVCSPDSTVSSLLTSCSIDSDNPYSDSWIQYKDKLYSSASEALEAYIEDFDLSLTSSEISTGKICIYQSTPKQVKFPKHRAKEKHAPEDFNQPVGLGSLASPSGRQIECDPDLISLATDDLLAFPADGSLPFVQPSPSKSRHPSKDQLELLISKADRGLESSTKDFSNNLENDGSPSTTDILGAERSWENAPGVFKPPGPVCCEDMENAPPLPRADIIQKFLEDCLNDKNKDVAFSGHHHDRPLEALKRMLFKLQAIQGSLSQNETAEQKEEFEKLSEKAEAELKLCDSERIPLTNSIRKALHHLSHLKSLVEDNQQEQNGDRREEKEEE